MWEGHTLRIMTGLAALALVSACGGAQEQSEEPAAVAPGGSEVTVVLPPAPPPADNAGDGETRAPARAPAVPDGGSVSGQQAAWASVLRRVGFPCERITSVREIGGGFRIQCAGGELYRGTRRDGRVKFRRWESA